MAITHFRSGTFELAIGVPVLTLKYDRQSEHQYGIGLPFGTFPVLTLPQCPQHRSLCQIASSNHCLAAVSLGNMSISSTTVMPSRWARPGALYVFMTP